MRYAVLLGTLLSLAFPSQIMAAGPCDNPQPGDCVCADTFCVVPASECAWDPDAVGVVSKTGLVDFFSGRRPRPTGIFSRLDVNCSGQVNLVDIIYMRNFLGGTGPAPKCCYYICSPTMRRAREVTPAEKLK